MTDANVVLGYLDPSSPLPGGTQIDRDAAARAVEVVGDTLSLSLEGAALGIVRVASAEMAQAVRVVTVERGIDPRELALVPFGGAGPLHAAAIADELGMDRIVVPYSSGVLSALGLVVSERRRDLAESVLLADSALTRDAVAQVVERLAARGREEIGGGEAEVRAAYDLRYAGQAFELTVHGGPAPEPNALRSAFDTLHRDHYGFDDRDAGLELVTVRVAVAQGGSEPELSDPPPAEDAGSRSVLFADGAAEARVVRGAPDQVTGPAIVELPGATLVVPPGWHCKRVLAGTLLMERR